METIFAASLVGVGGLAVVAWLALAQLTGRFGRVGDELVAAAESVQLAHRAEIALLLHARAADPLVRQELAAQLRRTVAAARGHVTSDEEATVLQRTETVLEAYLRAGAGGAPEEAFGALSALAAINLEQAHAARARLATWEREARQQVWVGVVGMTAIALGLLAWMRARIFRPMTKLAAAVGRFAGGDSGARVGDSGALEVRETALRFNELADELERRRKQQTAFLAGVAHDLRTPLSALVSSVAVIAASRDDAQRERATALLRRQLERLERMVGDLLDTMRIESGELELRRSLLDLRDVATTVVDLFQAVAQRHRLLLRQGAEPLVVDGDALRLEQLLGNLVSNAIKYTPEGGDVVVTCGVTAGGLCAVAVRDSGVGIPLAEHGRIFEPFRRASSAGDGTIPGVGLGLFVARRIAEAHGGRITVRSRPEEGSEFELLLPRAAPSPGASP